MYVFGVDSLFWELGVPNFFNNVYNPENDSWAVGAPMLNPRINAGLAVVDDVIYAIGGETMMLGQNTAASAANELYAPFGYGAIPSPSPIPTSSPSLTQQPTPSPSPTAEPTSTPKQQTGFLGTNLPTEYGYAIVAVLVIIIVAGLSLVYFKKQRRK
jgi:hypothetical protein